MTRAIERGEIVFFHRPRVGVEHVRSIDDVARFTFVLAPADRELERLLIVGRKRLPDPARHERAWALVAGVTTDPKGLGEELAPRVYETRTRGLRMQREARPAGEGRYVIADHDGHSHLAYVLELPHEPGDAQRMFNIQREAGFIVAVRNPEAPAPPGAGLLRGRRAQLPPQVMARFRGRRWLAVDDPAILDHPGVELVLIGARADVEGELGISLEDAGESAAKEELLAGLRAAAGDLRRNRSSNTALRPEAASADTPRVRQRRHPEAETFTESSPPREIRLIF